MEINGNKFSFHDIGVKVILDHKGSRDNTKNPILDTRSSGAFISKESKIAKCLNNLTLLRKCANRNHNKERGVLRDLPQGKLYPANQYMHHVYMESGIYDKMH
jgi:hypothetical protein